MRIHDSKDRAWVQRIAAFLICLLIILNAAPIAAQSAGETGNAGLHLPIVEPDPETSTGLKTTWSCVLYGAYPSCEVVDSTWAEVDEYALRDGDLIRDDALYTRLEAAEWENGQTALDGFSYLRVSLDQAPAAGGEREQHYHWEYHRPWHYFRIMPLRWRVLDIQENRALLLADRMPDCVPFHNGEEAITWEKCTLRSWLNGYGAEANQKGEDYSGIGFIDRAFTPQEQEAILPALCANPANQVYGTDSGRDTEDRLFILSNEEVYEGEMAERYGFQASRDYDDPAKRFTSTLYAKCMGAWWSPVDPYAGNSFWFMRTSGYTSRSVTYVCDFGYIYSRGTLADCSDASVLPAMWIDLDKADLTAAGETMSTQVIHTDREETLLPAEEISNPVTVANESMPGGLYTIWNAVTFGRYPQTEIREDPGTGGDAEINPELYRRLEEAAKETGDEVCLDDIRYIRLEDRWFRFDPIVWRVLEVADGTALLMSDKCLDCVPWNAEYTDVFWEGSGLRGWLNGKTDEREASPYGKRPFTETAFTEEELRAITVSAVSNPNNYYFGTACGSGTRDKVFLLSEEEIFSSEKAERYGFRPSDAVADPGRRLAPTAYAAARGAWQSQNTETSGKGFWLLRTNGYTPDNVVYVGEKGYLYNRGIPVTCGDAGIVPAIRVRLGTGLMFRTEDLSSKKE